MKKKVYYKLNRYQVTKVEVETVEQEQAVKMLNRDTDRFAKSEDTYRERYASLDEMYEESGFEPADDITTATVTKTSYSTLQTRTARIVTGA